MKPGKLSSRPSSLIGQSNFYINFSFTWSHTTCKIIDEISAKNISGNSPQNGQPSNEIIDLNSVGETASQGQLFARLPADNHIEKNDDAKENVD